MIPIVLRIVFLQKGSCSVGSLALFVMEGERARKKDELFIAWMCLILSFPPIVRCSFSKLIMNYGFG